MKTPLISVVVPIYKVESYLHKCVDSILSQTYNNIEIFLVDDGSPDNCSKICDEYAQKDKRIIVIHKKNGGLSDARNTAIDVAKGEYITFIDSDDWINKNYIKILYENLIINKADISCCSFMKVYERNYIEEPSSISNITKIYTPEEAIEKVLYQKQLDNAAWGKLFNKKLFSFIRFKTGILYEDLDLFYKLYEKADKIVHTNAILYYYLQRSNSILGKFDIRRIYVLTIVDEILQHMTKYHPNLVKAASDRKLSANFNILLLLLKNNIEEKDLVSQCWRNICKLRINSLFNKHVRLKNKIGILLSFFGLNFIKRISFFIK